MTTRPISARPLGTLALALSFAAAAWIAAPARADNSRGEAAKPLAASVPRDGTGWSNGGARLVPRGDGKYRLEYDATAPMDVGAGHPGEPVIVGNSDGNPVIEYLPPRPRR